MNPFHVATACGLLLSVPQLSKAGLPELVEQIREQVVTVRAYESSPDGQVRLHLLSGAVVDTSGLIATSDLGHVDSVRIALSDGRKEAGQLIASDTVFGLSYVRVPVAVPSAAALPDRRPRLGDQVIAAGYTGSNEDNLFFAVSQGIISSNLAPSPGNRGIPPGYWLATDLRPALGQNLLFDAAGHLLSVNSRREVQPGGDAPGTYYYPLADVSIWIRSELCAGRVPGHGLLGCVVVQSHPVQVGHVSSEALRQAGLRDGDEIVQYGTERLRGIPDLLRLAQGAQPGSEVEIVVRRGNEGLVHLRVRVGSR